VLYVERISYEIKCLYDNTLKYQLQQETPQCDETRFSTIQPSIDMIGIMKDGSE